MRSPRSVSSILAGAALSALLLAQSAPPATAGTQPAADAPPAAGTTAQPLERAHAHNDYEHDRPLLDAFDHGFTSVEVDVWLVDGELLVAHDAVDLSPERTLESLYLDPLQQRVDEQDGSVYPGWDGSVQLLIDIKTEGVATYAALHRELRRHPRLLTRWAAGRARPGAVTAVVSGNRPLEVMRAQRVRFAGYDGRLADLAGDLPASLMPLVSDNWTKHFTWNGVGEMPAQERAKLQAIVGQAHARGYRVRFWATPDVAGPARDALWAELVDAGVDHVNTDDLEGLQAFLLAHDPAERTAAA